MIISDIKRGISGFQESLIASSKIIINFQSVVNIFLVKETEEIENLAEFEPWTPNIYEDAIESLDEKISYLTEIINSSPNSDHNFSSIKIYLEELIPIFTPDEHYDSFDRDLESWIVSVLFSIEIDNKKLNQSLEYGITFYEQVTNLVFLKHKVFPFLTQSIYKLVMSGEGTLGIERSKNEDWNSVKQLVQALELDIEKEESYLRGNWASGLEQIEKLREKLFYLSNIMDYYWGRTSAIILSSSLDSELSSLEKKLQTLSTTFSPNQNFVFEFAKDFFELLDRIEAEQVYLENYGLKDKDNLMNRGRKLRRDYEQKCFALSGLTPKLDQNKITKNGILRNSKSKPKSEISHGFKKLATEPENNEEYIKNELNEFINKERYSETPNPEQMLYYDSLKLVLNNYRIFEEIRQWSGFISNTLKSIYIEINSDKLRGLINILDELLEFEPESLRFLRELESHIFKIEQMISAGELNSPVI